MEKNDKCGDCFSLDGVGFFFEGFDIDDVILAEVEVG